MLVTQISHIPKMSMHFSLRWVVRASYSSFSSRLYYEQKNKMQHIRIPIMSYVINDVKGMQI